VPGEQHVGGAAGDRRPGEQRVGDSAQASALGGEHVGGSAAASEPPAKKQRAGEPQVEVTHLEIIPLSSLVYHVCNGPVEGQTEYVVSGKWRVCQGCLHGPPGLPDTAGDTSGGNSVGVMYTQPGCGSRGV
jgi:hypothetical protein